MLDARLEAQRHVFGPLFPLVALAHLSRVLAAQPDEMRLSRQASLQGALTSKRWCVAVWGFRLVGSPSRERRERFMRIAHFKWPERGLAEGLLSGCALLRWSLGFQIAEQSSQGLLVVVVLLPAGEVGNVSHAFKMCCPTCCGLHDGVVKANGKEHQDVFLILFGKGGLNLEFYPRTCNGMLGEHQQQLVIQTNGLVDALPDFVTGLHVFRGKPAAHAFALQVGIQLVGKLLVVAGIANKTSIVLDGHQRAHVDDEVLWHTGFAQKDFGNASLRAVDGINANARWASMFYCLQSPHSTQIDIIKLCQFDFSITEVGITEVGIAEVGIAEVGTAEVGNAEVGKAEVDFAEVGSDEVRTTEVGTAEIWLCCWMLLSPCIPNTWPLLQHFKLVLICHVDYLLCSALIIERCGYDCKHFSFCFSSGERSPLVLIAKCRCSLRHDTGIPCLSKYITACLPSW